MDFPSSNNEPGFAICFTLVFETASFEEKTMKYFISSFYQSFLPPVKRVRSSDIDNLFYFHSVTL